MVKVTSEQRKLKESYHFQLKGEKTQGVMKKDIREGVSKLMKLKQFTKAIYRKILIKKHDQTYCAGNFTVRNFRDSLHVQLRYFNQKRHALGSAHLWDNQPDF
jgi:hypothetical protein